MPEELPAVWMWWMRSTGDIFAAHGVEAHFAGCSNDTLSAPSASMVVPGRMVSSCSSTGNPIRSNWDDRFIEIAGVARGGRFFVRAHGKSVHLFACEALQGRDQVG